MYKANPNVNHNSFLSFVTFIEKYKYLRLEVKMLEMKNSKNEIFVSDIKLLL